MVQVQGEQLSKTKTGGQDEEKKLKKKPQIINSLIATSFSFFVLFIRLLICPIELMEWINKRAEDFFFNSIFSILA